MSARKITQSLILIGAFATLAASPAAAHVGSPGHVHGFGNGFIHPFTGIDHLLAMIAVGMYAAVLGGRAMWLVPASFIAMMTVGGALGMAHIGLPIAETAIAASVIVLGLAVALKAPLPMIAAMALVGFFAVFHGYAHGSEMPADASAAAYAAGFIAATAALHAFGLALGISLTRSNAAAALRLDQLGGGAMALAGTALLTGWL